MHSPSPQFEAALQEFTASIDRMRDRAHTADSVLALRGQEVSETEASATMELVVEGQPETVQLRRVQEPNGQSVYVLKVYPEHASNKFNSYILIFGNQYDTIRLMGACNPVYDKYGKQPEADNQSGYHELVDNRLFAALNGGVCE